ncbi:hypothetical protein Cni_G05974 [Canna indica]|uniref:Uncharacterized protein n=1 Tax=Canna indica TaxID=4628 RepID=A0AAQ3JWB5_9LILI|nr:hypothetical protein Cni_G05974 [Canna indica]
MRAEDGKACGSAATDSKVATSTPLMDLLDELWFFHSTLRRRRPASKALPPSPPPSRSPEKPEEEVVPFTESSVSPCGQDSRSKTPPENPPRAARKMLRAPSMTSYRTRQEEYAAICARKKSSGGSGITGGSRIDGPRQSLARTPSLPAYCGGHGDGVQGIVKDRPRPTRNSKLQRSSSGFPTPNPSMSRLRPPSEWKEEDGAARYFASQTHLFIEANHKKYSIQGKNWRSYSNLESFEVQGFKDLGFVVEEEAPGSEGSSPRLQEKRSTPDESWFVESPKLEWAERRSAADMKEQLKFWARTVACNVRQES